MGLFRGVGRGLGGFPGSVSSFPGNTVCVPWRRAYARSRKCREGKKGLIGGLLGGGDHVGILLRESRLVRFVLYLLTVILLYVLGCLTTG